MYSKKVKKYIERWNKTITAYLTESQYDCTQSGDIDLPDYGFTHFFKKGNYHCVV